MMRGYKTWMAVVGAVAYAVGGFFYGAHDADKMIEIIIAAVGLVGIGHKLDKASGQALAEAQPMVQSVRVVNPREGGPYVG